MIYLGVSENRGTPKSSILIGFSIINHPFWGTTILGNPHLKKQQVWRDAEYFPQKMIRDQGTIVFVGWATNSLKGASLANFRAPQWVREKHPSLYGCFQKYGYPKMDGL